MTLAALFAALGFAPPDGPQRSRAGNVRVQARVVDKCAIGTTPMSFRIGSQPMPAGVESIGTVAFDCTKGTRAELTLDAGQNERDGRRRLASSAGTFIEYELYQDQPLTRPWGAGTEVAVYVVPTTQDDDPTAATAPRGLGSGSLGPIPTGPTAYLASLLTVLSFVPPPLARPLPALPAVTAIPASTGVVVYGRVFPGQEPSGEDYRDVVRATVFF